MTKIVLISGVFASLAFAEVKLSPSYDKCMDKSGGITSSMLECYNKETKLNKAMKELL
jgi:hypothetical protein